MLLAESHYIPGAMHIPVFSQRRVDTKVQNHSSIIKPSQKRPPAKTRRGSGHAKMATGQGQSLSSSIYHQIHECIPVCQIYEWVRKHDRTLLEKAFKPCLLTAEQRMPTIICRGTQDKATVFQGAKGTKVHIASVEAWKTPKVWRTSFAVL